MTKQKLWELIEAYRMSGGSEEHHARKEQLDAVLDGLLAQPEQEPVAMRYDFDGYGYKYIDSGSGSDWKTRIKGAEPLCTTPPHRKPLDEREREWVVSTCPTPRHIIKAVEAAHGIKE